MFGWSRDRFAPIGANLCAFTKLLASLPLPFLRRRLQQLPNLQRHYSTLTWVEVPPMQIGAKADRS
jgi:hypothetical protein